MTGWLIGTSRAAEEAMDAAARAAVSDLAQARRFSNLLAGERAPRRGINYSTGPAAAGRIAITTLQAGLQRATVQIRAAAARYEEAQR